jgi:hypothetical protein
MEIGAPIRMAETQAQIVVAALGEQYGSEPGQYSIYNTSYGWQLVKWTDQGKGTYSSPFGHTKTIRELYNALCYAALVLGHQASLQAQRAREQQAQ